MIVTQIFIGIAAGASFPAFNVLLSVWIPESERGKLGALVLSGGQVSMHKLGLLVNKINFELESEAFSQF